MRLVYLDSSAIVKLIVAEPETEALIGFLSGTDASVTSRVGAVEVARAAARHGGVEPRRLDEVLEVIDYVELTPDVVARAAGLAPTTLQTLDAIHLASAIGLRSELAAFLTYDDRLAEAARLHRLQVAAPAP